MLPSKYTDFDV